ncbi:glycine receptor subunit alpha-2-like isoform X2 [Lineus longissimus]|uniref:glycine receptor subunit alpha-2-like isoform X2 n=1 Tax=Lineus longissimus TaxID=88925 RepID=UPI00315D219B
MNLLSTSRLLLLVGVLYWTAAEAAKKKKGESSRSSSRKKYDRSQPPDNENSTVVEVSIFVNRITQVDEKNMAFTVDMNFRQTWFDPRLQFTPTPGRKDEMKLLDESTQKNVWKPDTYFRNLIGVKTYNEPTSQKLLRLYNNGRLWSAQRMEATFHCAMGFERFPFDYQMCPINIESFANTMDTFGLMWTPTLAKPVQLSETVRVPNFVIAATLLIDCTKNYTVGTASYPCLRVEFLFDRDLALYIKDFYIPQILLVVVSFISFFIKMDAILARMTLLIVTSVTMVAHAVFSTFRLSLPSVPYYTALDIWSTVCFAFIFLTIIEFALVAGFSRKKPAVHCENNSNSLAMDHEGESTKRRSYSIGQNDKTSQAGRRIDMVSRVFFPLAFIGYNIIYWIFFLLIGQPTY